MHDGGVVAPAELLADVAEREVRHAADEIHGDLAAVAPLPRAHFTKPNIVIKPNANSRPTGDTTGYLANPKEV